ncbi:S-methyl-5'-thioadenosine phosphorylase [soil metagenome]
MVGDRLAVVLGSSFESSPFDGGGAVEQVVAGTGGGMARVALVDHGGFVVLRRHGLDGRVPAHRVDHEAHVRALCAVGCDRVLAIGSAGGLQAELGPGTVACPDDLFALGTYPTFHHTTDGYAMPGFDAAFRAEVLAAWALGGRPVVDGGTYAQVRGPRFETPAEVRHLAAFADLVGMTLAAECFLATEAGLAHAALVKVDNLANGLAAAPLRVSDYLEAAAEDAPAFGAAVVELVAALTH